MTAADDTPANALLTNRSFGHRAKVTTVIARDRGNLVIESTAAGLFTARAAECNFHRPIIEDTCGGHRVGSQSGYSVVTESNCDINSPVNTVTAAT